MGIYYSPEDSGGRMVGSVDTGDGYDFNMLAVFQRESDGALYWDTDSGCSCFSPFDEATWETMTPIHDTAKFAKDARTWVRGGSADEIEAINRLIVKVRKIHRAVNA